MRCFKVKTFLLMITMVVLFTGGQDVYAAKKQNNNLLQVNIGKGYVLPVHKSMVIRIKKGKKIQKNNQYFFYSSNKKVISISASGKIKALKKGTSFITIKNKKNKKQILKVKIYAGKRVTSLKANRKKTLRLIAGDQLKIGIKIKPASAKNKKLEWLSSNKTICKVTSKGMITALRPGSAIISVKTTDGSKLTLKFKIIVSKKTEIEQEETEEIIPITSVKIKTNKKYPYLYVGEKLSLKAQIQPTNAEQEIVWSSSDAKVASIDQKGNLTALKTGKAKIKVSVKDNPNICDYYDIIVPSFDSSVIKLIAHRGYSSVAPENTIAAFEMAVSNKFDAVECDVYKTTDGVFVVHHDYSLKRIFDDERLINECSYEEIKDLVAKNGAGLVNYPEEKIKVCTLRDYMNILKNSDKCAVIELKQVFSQEDFDELYSLILSYDMNERVYIISYFKDALLSMEQSVKNYDESHPGEVEIHPQFFLLTNTPEKVDENFDSATALQWALAHGYHVDSYYINTTQETIAQAHQDDKKVGIFTVDNFEIACHYIFDLGVDFVTSNRCLFYED